MSRYHHAENHYAGRTGWLRAAVLGANDGLLSTSGLVVGVAASGAEAAQVLGAGLAGLVAGAVSMAAGEYVSVRAQADAEAADLAIEKHELRAQPHHELAELADIYRRRGLDADLAARVAQQLTAHNALAAHARDELGITATLRARPVQAAGSSALSFSLGAALPIAAAWLATQAHVVPVVSIAAVAGLALLGALGAYLGGSPVLRGTLRVTGWGVLAMAATTLLGRFMGTA